MEPQFRLVHIINNKWYTDILPKDTLPKDILPKDILPNGHFAERTSCRTDSLPKGQLAENRDVILSKCLGL
jgi:hypothetical protein